MKQKLLKTMLLLCALIVGGSAWATDPSITLTQSNLELTGTYSSSASKTIGGVTFVHTDLMKNNTDIQVKASTGVIYNSTAFPGEIVSVAITHTGTARSTTIQGSTDGSTWKDVNTGSGSITGDFSGKGYRYFKITRGSNAAYWSSIVITYAESSAEATTTTIDYSGITNTNLYYGTSAGSFTATVQYGSPASAVPGAAVTWSSSKTGVATINSTTGEVTLVGVGSTTITATYAGVADEYLSSTNTYDLDVEYTNPYWVSVWSEDFSGYVANDVPSGGDYSYVSSDGGTNTKIYAENSAGGSSPELLVSKKGGSPSVAGSFTATIPLNNKYTGTLKLTFKNNNPLNVSVIDNGDNVLYPSTSIAKNTSGNTLLIPGVTAETTSITIVWSNSSTSSNARLDDIELLGEIAAPTFSPSAGDILKGSAVTINAAAGVTIRYTTDGSTPTTSTGTVYDPSSKPTISSATTIKAIAVVDGEGSQVATAAYTLLKPTAPVFSPGSKDFDSSFGVTISGSTGTTLKYTTDGSNPSSSGTATAVDSNSKTITISGTSNVTVKAIAILDGVESLVGEATYTYDTRTTPTFTPSTTDKALIVNVAGEISLDTNHDGTITATSSDDMHLIVDYNSGTKIVSLLADLSGSYTVTLSATGSATYRNASVTIDVTVSKKVTTMALDTDFSDGKDLRYGDEGLIEGTVKYNDVALSPQPTITYTSSDEDVATVDEDGNIAFVAAGSTTLTVSYAGSSEYAACENTYVLTLTDSRPQEMEVDVAFNNTLYGTSFTGANAAGEGSSKRTVSGTIKNVSVTTYQGSGTNLFVNNSETRIYNNGTITIAAPTGYLITQIVFNDGTAPTNWSVSPSVGTLTSATWSGSSSSIVFTASGRSDFTIATITLAETVTVGSAGYTTYVTRHDVSFPGTVTAYIATAKSSSTLTLTSTGSAPEGTPIVVKAAAGTYNLTVIDAKDAADVGSNLLSASDGSVVGDESTIYGLGVGKDGDATGKIGFYLVGSGIEVPAGKAYLEVTGSPVKGFTFVFEEDDTDGIDAVNGEGFMVNGPIYNLAGQRINKLQKGINIVNGKKVLY